MQDGRRISFLAVCECQSAIEMNGIADQTCGQYDWTKCNHHQVRMSGKASLKGGGSADACAL